MGNCNTCGKFARLDRHTDECHACKLGEGYDGYSPRVQYGPVTCRDAATSNCSGPAKYAGRCGKHAAQARRR